MKVSVEPQQRWSVFNNAFLSVHFTRWRVRCWIWENFCTDKKEFYMLFDVVGVTTAGSVRWTEKKWTGNVSLEINRVGHLAELLKLQSHCSRVKVWTHLSRQDLSFERLVYTAVKFRVPKNLNTHENFWHRLLKLREVYRKRVRKVGSTVFVASIHIVRTYIHYLIYTDIYCIKR
jgi:hypothetical protein